jgi:GntR family transcriptional regulator/MocR family aminotransferase
MIDGGHFERHINRLKNHYKIIRQAILDKAKSLPFRCELKDTGSGLHLLAYIPDAESDKQIKEVALSHGINIRCLSDYLVAPLKGVEKMAVVNYSGVTKEQIEGIKL